MVPELDPVAGNGIEGRSRVVSPREQPVSQLVNDQEDDVVRRLANGVGASLLTFLSLQVGTSDKHYQADT
jgi:hypothetical protein